MVPSPNTFPEEEPSGLLKEGAEPKPAVPPNAGDPPKVGGLPKTGALPKPAGLVGVENDPKPCAATDPEPELNEPLGFCSPNELPPKLKPFAPLFPNRLDGPVLMGWPNPPAAGVPNGFLLAASSLGFPPRPLKNPDPDEAFPVFDPNRLPPD